MKQKKTGFIQNIVKKFKKYNESSILLYLLSVNFSNLKREIIAKSPNVSRKEENPNGVFTPEQINEARQHPTGFIKLAIQTIAKRQKLVNLLDKQKQYISGLINELEHDIITVLQTVDYENEKTFNDMKKLLKTFKENYDKLLVIEKQANKQIIIIDKLINKHSREWNEHKQCYVEKFIQDLQKHNIVLSELEKNELLHPTKTLEEIKQNIEATLK